MVADEAVDTVVPVVILRDGQQMTLMVKLGELKDTATQVATATPPPSATPAPATPSAPTTPSTPAPTVGVTGPLGLTLTDLSQAVRDKLGLSDKITKGVAVLAVEQGSVADLKRLQPGDVIVQVEQEDVATPDDLGKKLDALKMQGRTTAQLVVENKDGNVRFVNVTIQ
jgi:serine protease Do